MEMLPCIICKSQHKKLCVELVGISLLFTSDESLDQKGEDQSLKHGPKEPTKGYNNVPDYEENLLKALLDLKNSQCLKVEIRLSFLQNLTKLLTFGLIGCSI